MPQEIKVTDADILYAESVLLPHGHCFDPERIAFISNFETIDLQAVPGSGKTTALIAKLLILDRYLPFEDGSGVLVISHTNAAINEIKSIINKYCKNLMNYPNFIGTIQSFVDEYLAIPYYCNLYNRRPSKIDSEFYYKNHYIPYQAKGYLEKHEYQRSAILYNSRVFDANCLKIGIEGKEFPVGKETQTYKSILAMKMKLRENGYLSFEDAYILAFEYLKNIANVKNVLQQRFRYIFVDEMQDMDKHQYDLLESIFFHGGVGYPKYQRIGDKNQSIYDSENKVEVIWVDRNDILRLNGSYRLNPKIADIVKPFATSEIDIEGRMSNPDGSPIDIKPHMIVYTGNSIEQVIPKFGEIIETLQMSDKIPVNYRNIYKAIAWISRDNGVKTTISSYYPNFSRDVHVKKSTHDCLSAYINQFNPIDKSFKSIQDRVIQGFLEVLRRENIKDSNDRLFSGSSLLRFINENDALFKEEFNLNLYLWCKEVIQGKSLNAIIGIRAYIPKILEKLGFEIVNSSDFIYSDCDPVVPQEEIINVKNVYKIKEINIEISTIHSVKGQTHTATLYMETFFEKGLDNHESGRLAGQFLGSPFSQENTSEVQFKSAKMSYVGFSRPTHLLCFAVHKERFNKYLTEIDRNIWEIIEI